MSAHPNAEDFKFLVLEMTKMFCTDNIHMSLTKYKTTLKSRAANKDYFLLSINLPVVFLINRLDNGDRHPSQHPGVQADIVKRLIFFNQQSKTPKH